AESEIGVEAVLGGGERGRPLRIADLGVGSGAILLALLSELPAACGVGTDRDANVLGVARDNARRLGLASRAGFVACDFGAALAGGGGTRGVKSPPCRAPGHSAGCAGGAGRAPPRPLPRRP